MTTLITRLYAISKDASAVADALTANLFKTKHFDVIAMPEGKKLSAKAALAAIHDDLSRAGVIPRSAAVYADKIVEGNALVAVRAPVGASQAAKAILNAFPSIDAGVRDEVHIPAEVSRPAKRYRPSATSLLARDAMILSGKKFLPPLTSSQRTFSGMFGLPLLSRKGPRAKLVSGSTTPFSSMLGLPLLSKSRS
jgi:hypothetical protein